MVRQSFVDPQHTLNSADSSAPPANIAPAQQLMDSNWEHMLNMWRYCDTDNNEPPSNDDPQFSLLHQTQPQISLEILLSTMLPLME